MEPLRLRLRHQGGVAVLTVSGELDLETGPTLESRVASLVADGDRQIVLDLAPLGFCDARGISVLLRALDKAQDVGGWLRVARMRPHLRRVLRIVDLTDHVPAFTTISGAVAGRGGVHAA